MSFLHNLGHKHWELHKDDIGVFSFCEQRWRWGGVRVVFRPAFSMARWHPVPAADQDEEVPVLARMIKAGSPHEAMALLREAYAENGITGC